MTLYSCAFSSQVSVSFLWIDWPRLPSNTLRKNIVSKRCLPSLKRKNTEMFGQQVGEREVNLSIRWSSLGGSRIISRPNFGSKFLQRKSLGVYASWLPSCQIASNAFTLGTVFVLPFYTLMVIAPRAEFTKKLVSSSIPYIVLGVLYAYLLYVSWTPDTIRLMFASKYWLPQLSGIAKMFTSKMTLASAWIHLLVVDLFAARQIYHDGLQNNIETRHSVSLCLMFCPVGILAHFITKALTRTRGESRHEIHHWQQ